MFSLTGGQGGGGGGGQQQAAADGDGASPGKGNPMSALSFLSSRLPVGAAYFASERSFAQLRLPDTHRALVGFGKDPTTLLIVSSTGAFYKVGAVGLGCCRGRP